MQKATRAGNVAAWVIAILLCVAFLGAGLSKMTSQPMMVTQFQMFGLPLWFMYVTGLIEIVGAVLVVMPRTARLGAAAIVSVMVGAPVAHLTRGQVARMAPPLVLLVLAVAEFYLRGGFRAPLLRAATPRPR